MYVVMKKCPAVLVPKNIHLNFVVSTYHTRTTEQFQRNTSENKERNLLYIVSKYYVSKVLHNIYPLSLFFLLM